MYEDILDDPEVQEMIDKYDGTHQNDVPLDDFGKPLLDILDEDDENKNDEDDKKDNDEENKDEEVALDESLLEEFVEKVPEVDYTPQTEFGKSLDLDKIDDGFQKYILTHLEPLTVTDSEGKTIRAYTKEDIPADFKYADEQASAKAHTELGRLQERGDILKKEYDEALSKRDAVMHENDALSASREGLLEAIGNGEFPKLEIDKDGKIDSDSKINQLAEDVITYQKETNKDRTPARSISFDTALNRFKKYNPDRFKDLEGSLAKEDAERAKFAKRTSRSSQRTSSNSTKSVYDDLSREEFDQLLNDPNFDVRKLLK